MLEIEQNKNYSSKTIKSLFTDIFLIDEIQTYQTENANIVGTLICRSVLIITGIYFNYFVACTQGATYYSLLVFTLVILIETIYICIKRKGLDFKWYNYKYFYVFCKINVFFF